MISAIFSFLMLGAIALDGVTGQDISARAFFDANNVRLGDPMVLTVEFTGSADFASLHPPALSKETDRRTWRVDDTSAKTETGEIGRRLVYRVRPLKEGVLVFPALSFSYTSARGEAVEVSTSPIPVHVKPGAQAALAGLDADADGLPMPDGIVTSVVTPLGDDELFRWRKACRTPTAAAFAAFDFPEARLNEAACHIVEGNWAKAIRVYSILEWRTGQTPAIERGIVAALARKHSSAAVELPVWRSSFRGVLRFAWLGRILVILGVLASAALLVWIARRVVRALACVALLLAVSAASDAVAQQAIDPFEEMDRMMQRAFGNMNSLMGVGTGLTVNGQQVPPPEVKATAAASKADPQVGDDFDFVVSVEAPRSVTLDQVRVTISEMFGLVVRGGRISNLPSQPAKDPSNIVHRISVPVRYDAPFRGRLVFTVQGMASGTMALSSGRSRSSYTFSQSFSAATPPLDVEIRPLPTDGQPADFSGAVGTDFKLRMSVNRNRVATNDVVTATCRLTYSGYVPPDAVRDVVERRPGSLAWTKYFVADGSARVPDESIVCYDTDSRTYKTIVAKGVALSYVPESLDESVAVAVDTADEKGDGRVLKLRFAPSASAPLVATVPRPDATPAPTEQPRGEWVRIDVGGHAGWVRKDDLR